MSAHKDNASMRYFLASLKPFGRPLFWAPLGLASLALMFYWQYSQQPALLQTRTNDDQPRQNLDQAVNGTPDMTQLPLNDLVSTDINDLQARQAAKNNQRVAQKPAQLDPDQVWSFNQADKNAPKKTINSSSLFAPLIQNNQNAGNSGSSLFVPLVPQVKQNSQASTYTRTALQPIQVTPPSASTRQSALQSAMTNVPVNRYNNPTYNNGVNPATTNNYSRGGAPDTGYQQGQNPAYQSNSPYSNPHNQNPVNANSAYSNQPPRNSYQGAYQGMTGQPDPGQYGGQSSDNAPRYGVQPSSIEPRARY